MSVISLFRKFNLFLIDVLMGIFVGIYEEKTG